MLGFTGSVNRNLAVVVRGVNERTESVCCKLLAEDVADNNIHLVHKSPFSAALKKSYEIGIIEGRRWTLVVDTDVLIRPGIVRELYRQIRSRDI